MKWLFWKIIVARSCEKVTQSEMNSAQNEDKFEIIINNNNKNNKVIMPDHMKNRGFDGHQKKEKTL